MKSKISILFAVFALIAATLACAVGEPALGNLRMAKDKDGAQLSTVFAAQDTIYVVGDLTNGVKGNIVTSKWYTDKVEGYEPGYLIDSSDLNIDKDGSYSINFYFEPPTNGWPVGTYKVEIYFNSTLHSALNFSVQ